MFGDLYRINTNTTIVTQTALASLFFQSERISQIGHSVPENATHDLTNTPTLQPVSLRFLFPQKKEKK